jgi:DNA-binding transcriptional MerR regulator
MPKKHLYTSEVARAANVHPNTVRLYEEWGYLPPARRSKKGYRLFTEYHLDQMALARLAFQGPYPGGKAPVEALVRAAAAHKLGDALEHAYRYLSQIRAEYAQAEAAALLLERWAGGIPIEPTTPRLRIKQVAQLLDIAAHRLRDWERNGLLAVPRQPRSGYRWYSAEEIGRLRVIRMLRASGYSTMAILRLMNHLDSGRAGDLRLVLDTPDPDSDVWSAADSWLSTLKAQEQRALDIISFIEGMVTKYRS